MTISGWSAFAVFNSGPRNSEIKDVISDIYLVQKTFLIDVTKLSRLLIDDARERSKENDLIPLDPQQHEEIVMDEQSFLQGQTESSLDINLEINEIMPQELESNLELPIESSEIMKSNEIDEDNMDAENNLDPEMDS